MVFVVLEGKIVLSIFAEVHGPGLRWNPLEGVVAEFTAVVTDGDDSFFGTEHHFLVHFCAVAAILAGPLHLLSKQHSDPFLSRLLYNSRPGISTIIFAKINAGIKSRAAYPS